MHIPQLTEESKFNVQVDVARGRRDIEDLDAFDEQAALKRLQQKHEQEKQRQVKGLLPQLAKVAFKKAHGFSPGSFERLIAYVKNYEREKLDLPQKHFFLGHHEYDCLTSRVDRLNRYAPLTSNSKIMSLLYVAGLNTSAHDNLVWNTRFNCLVYTFENKIILEEFEEVRNQTVINLPEIISCLHLAQDGCTVAVGCGTVNHDIYAPVYILDLKSQTLKARLNHHTRGVQGVRFSPDNRYLLSYGNFKDGRIALWKDRTTLLFSTTDAFPMHEAKWRPEPAAVPGAPKQQELEFAMGGKNRLAVWRFHQELGRCSIKSERGFSVGGYCRDVTALEYVHSLMKGWLLLVGLHTGTLVFVDPADCTVVSEYSVSLKEISVIKYSQDCDKLVVGTLAGEVFHWRFSTAEPESIEWDVDVRKMKLEAGIVNLDLDPDFVEGVASTIDAQIAFITLNNSKYANFIQGIDSHNLAVHMIQVGDKAVLTIHNLGDAKLWNAQTGEILKELKWKEQITFAMLVEEKNLLVFFLKNHDLVTMPLDDFAKLRLFNNNSVEQLTDGYMDNHITRGAALQLDENHKTYLFSSFKGVTFVTDFLGEDAFDFRIVQFEGLAASVSCLEFSAATKTLAIGTSKGHIHLYRCEDSTQSLDKFNFYLLEDFNCVEKPHGNIDSNEEDESATLRLYGYKSHIVSLKFVLSQKSQYCYILESLMYIYVRDYEKKEVPAAHQMKYILTTDSFPRSIARDPFNNRILVGREGSSA